MAKSYRYKDEVERAWDANVKRIRNEVNIVADRVKNELLSEAYGEFAEAQKRGEILEFYVESGEVKAKIQKVIEDGE